MQLIYKQITIKKKVVYTLLENFTSNETCEIVCKLINNENIKINFSLLS